MQSLPNWRARVGLGIVCLGTLIAPLDSAVNIALPSISDAFAVGLEEIRWVVICYVLTYSSLLLIFGKIGDLAGYRRVFQLGLVVSFAGFMFCAMAPSFAVLLAGRVVQGVGIALTLSCAPALATTLFDEKDRTRVLGTYAAMAAIGAALGPLVGGALISYFGWTVVFAMRAPLALIAFALSWSIPDTPRGPARSAFDYIGALLLIGWLVPLLMAVALRGDTAGPGIRLGLAGGAAIAFATFIVHEIRHPEPIIRPRLFRSLEFTLMNVISIVMNFAAFSILLLVPYFLVRISGLDSTRGGIVLALAAAGTVAGSWATGKLAARVGIGRLALIGVCLSIAGLAGISFWTKETAFALIAVTLIVQGVGVGLFTVAYTDLVTAILPQSDRGVAGSLTMVTRTIGVVAGASGHSALQKHIEDAARLAGAAPDAAFVEGFQVAFQVAAGAVGMALLVSFVNASIRTRRTI